MTYTIIFTVRFSIIVAYYRNILPLYCKTAMVNIGQSHIKKFIFKDNTLEERINA